MSYFILTSGEDGISIREVTEKELLDGLVPDQYGDVRYPGPFLKKIPRSDKGCWMGVDDYAALIIKGEIVQPIPEQVAIRYSIP